MALSYGSETLALVYKYVKGILFKHRLIYVIRVTTSILHVKNLKSHFFGMMELF